jgi:hypothetical protein
MAKSPVCSPLAFARSADVKRRSKEAFKCKTVPLASKRLFFPNLLHLNASFLQTFCIIPLLHVDETFAFRGKGERRLSDNDDEVRNDERWVDEGARGD